MYGGKPLIIKCKLIEAKRERSEDEEEKDTLKKHHASENTETTEDTEDRDDEPYIEEVGFFYEGYIGAGAEALILKLIYDDDGSFVVGKFFYNTDITENEETILFMQETLKAFKPFCLFPMAMVTYPKEVLLNPNGDLPMASMKRILGPKAVQDLSDNHNIDTDQQLLYGGFFIMSLMSGDLGGYTQSGSKSIWEILRNDETKRKELLQWIHDAKAAALTDKFYHGDLQLNNILYAWIPKTNQVIYRVSDFSSAVFPIEGDLPLEIDHIQNIESEWNRVENAIKHYFNQSDEEWDTYTSNIIRM